MDAFFQDSKPDLVIISADWLEYARPPRFDGMIADLKHTIARLNRAALPWCCSVHPCSSGAGCLAMLMRAQLRGIELRADDFVLPDIFALDARMRAALPPREKFSYVSVVNAICPARQCPLTVGEDVPLAWDHAHLTAEGSEYVVGRFAAMLGLKK